MADRIDLKDADWLTDLAAGQEVGAELRATLASRLESAEQVERAANEIDVARRIQVLMQKLREAEVEVPEDFEVRLMERVAGDQTMLEMVELYMTGFGGALVELINVLFSFLAPAPQAQFRTS